MTTAKAAEVPSVWPEMSKELDENRCQETFMSLLTTLETDVCNTSRIIHGLKYTASCDHYYDLSHIRRHFEKRMSAKALGNILDYAGDKSDIKEGETSVYHNLAWTKRELMAGLSTKNKIGYMAYFHFDKWLLGSSMFVGAVLFGKRFMRLRRSVQVKHDH